MAERIRIQKALSRAGLMSRRSAELAIESGRVTIDKRVAVLGDRIDVSAERLELDGVPVPVDPALETHLLYKPVGVVSSAKDEHGRTTVVDLVNTTARVYPVGRLDRDSEGLILVSNDGDLTNWITHPRHGVTKTYVVKILGVPTRHDLDQLITGIDLEDGRAAAKRVRLKASDSHNSLVELKMGEGRNREIRRMFSALGHEVESLVRIAIGPISDRTLKPGSSRRLEAGEIRALWEAGND